MSEAATLFIDIGNSRLKWQVGLGSNQSSVEGCAYEDSMQAAVTQLKASVNEMLQQLDPSGSAILQQIMVASVKNDFLGQTLSAALQQEFGITPRFAKTHKRQAGLSCSYQEPKRLGVDRWLAMLAGFHLHRKDNLNLCVVDFGTATTVDVVTSSGLHQGGFIIPGAALMEKTLLNNTDKVRFTEEEKSQGRPLSWGKSTADAVKNGANFSQLAILEKAASHCKEQHGLTQTIITGGFGASLTAHFLENMIYVPDLVLQGLLIYSQHPEDN